MARPATCLSCQETIHGDDTQLTGEIARSSSKKSICLTVCMLSPSSSRLPLRRDAMRAPGVYEVSAAEDQRGRNGRHLPGVPPNDPASRQRGRGQRSRGKRGILTRVHGSDDVSEHTAHHRTDSARAERSAGPFPERVRFCFGCSDTKRCYSTSVEDDACRGTEGVAGGPGAQDGHRAGPAPVPAGLGRAGCGGNPGIRPRPGSRGRDA